MALDQVDVAALTALVSEFTSHTCHKASIVVVTISKIDFDPIYTAVTSFAVVWNFSLDYLLIIHIWHNGLRTFYIFSVTLGTLSKADGSDM